MITEQPSLEAFPTHPVDPTWDAEAMFRVAVEASPVGVLIADDEGRILLANKAARTMFGYGDQGLVGEKVDRLVPTPLRVQHAQHRADFMAAQEQRPMGAERNLTGLRHDGTEFPIEVGLTPVRTAEGDRVVVVVVDISRRKAAEADAQRNRADAEARKLEALGRLAGGIGHNFNNLLAVIQGNASLALELTDPAEKDSLLRDIAAAAESAASLTSELLSFGRRSIVTPETIELGEFLRSLAPRLERFKGKGVVLSIEGALGCLVRADRVQMEQVIMNLAKNAWDAMPAAGVVTLTVKPERVANVEDISGRLLPPGDYVCLCVSDTGHGFDAKTKALIFEPFFTTKGHSGTGMGLASVLGSVTQAKGYMTVESEPGTGSTFCIYLPALTTAPAPPKTVEPTLPDCERGHKETILLVDDQPGVLEVCRKALESAGYHVLAALGGRAATRLAQEHIDEIQLVLTDVVMPDVSGRAVADFVRALRPDIKVMYLSGYTADETLRHGVAEAEAAFLQKPFTPAALRKKVQVLLHERNN